MAQAVARRARASNSSRADERPPAPSAAAARSASTRRRRRRPAGGRRPGPAARPGGCTGASRAPRSRRRSRPSRSPRTATAASASIAVVAAKREDQERPGSARAARSRSRWGSSTGRSGWPRLRLGRRRARAVEPEQPRGRSAGALIRRRRGLATGASSPQLGHRAARRPRPRAPAGRLCARGAPAPRARPTRSERRPTVTRSGQPSSSASANFSPAPASRSS